MPSDYPDIETAATEEQAVEYLRTARDRFRAAIRGVANAARILFDVFGGDDDD